MGSVNRRYSFVRLFTATMLVGAGSLAGASFAQAQATLADFSEQRLDRVDVVSLQRAFEVSINQDLATKPWVSTEYPAVVNTSVPGTSFTACQNTATRGLYCLDGNKVRRWPNPEKTTGLDPAVDGVELFNCSNAAFALDSGATCTALAVDLGGHLWLAGKKKSKFSLFRVVEGDCPKGAGNEATKFSKWTAVNSRYCAREFASGRPLLIDLTTIEGDVAASFPYSEGGVLGVEERREVTFFKDTAQAPPVVVGSGTVWKLGGGEQLQSATLLQKPFDVGSRNWVLVTTSSGRLLSREVPWNPAIVTPVINHTPANGLINLVAPVSCGPTALYATRASVKTRAVYVSDRRGCRLWSLKSNIDSIADATTPLSFVSQEIIASTSPTSSTIATLTAPPEAVSIAPGIEVDLRDECGFNPDGSPKTCALVGDGGDLNNFPGASLTGVRIDDGTPSGLTVFQILNIPDCRYLEYNFEMPAECKGTDNLVPSNSAILKANGAAVVYPTDYNVANGSAFPKNPELLVLNVTPLLPPEVTMIVPASDPLPRMIISPKYKALASRRVFDALFGVTDLEVRFRDTFNAEFDLGDLLPPGDKLGCGGASFIDTTVGPLWDVLLTISETFTTVGGFVNEGPQHTDMLVNTDPCTNEDPPAAGSRWSLYTYGLQMSEERVPNRVNPAVLETRYSDSIFAKLVLSLFNDLGETIDTYLCVNADPGGSGAPVAPSACGTLQGAWDNTADKLGKCVESSTEPKTPSGIQTCQAFEIQYATFSSQVDALVRSGSDPANRVGEVKARKEVFRYVYDRQYLPSIPPLGFIDGL
jgi:hypothetical protein